VKILASLPLVNLWSMRSLILHFALMSIKIRFKGTYLGFAWTAIEPTLTFVILYIVFTNLRFNVGENYGIYLLTGVFVYHIFVRGTMGGLTSLRSNRAVLESLNIRKEFFPVVNTVSTCFLILIEVAVLFAVMAFFGFIPPWTIVFLPIVMLYLILLIHGVTSILSIVNVYVPDILPFWGVFTHALFFLSPVFWKLENAMSILQEIHKINPIGQIIELNHKILVYGEIPPITEWLYTLVFVVGFFIVGYAIFQKFESKTVEAL